MDSIFSDDEEFDALRDQLFDGHLGDENEKVVPMYGSYAILKKEGVQKQRQDLFLRPMVAPSNDMMPYENGAGPHKKAVMQKTYQPVSFSFFGMRGNKIKMEKKPLTVNKYIEERNDMLQKLKASEEAVNGEEEGDSDCDDGDFYTTDSPPPKRTPVRRSQRKRKRVAVSSSSEDEEEEESSDSRVRAPSSARSPRRKRVSPP